MSSRNFTGSGIQMFLEQIRKIDSVAFDLSRYEESSRHVLVYHSVPFLKLGLVEYSESMKSWPHFDQLWIYSPGASQIRSQRSKFSSILPKTANLPNFWNDWSEWGPESGRWSPSGSPAGGYGYSTYGRAHALPPKFIQLWHPYVIFGSWSCRVDA